MLDPPLVIQFTTDGGHLVVAYKAYGPPDANPFAVWDLGTQKIVRLVNYENADKPMAVLPGSYPGSMWVASVAIGTTDAGADISTVTLMDVSQASPSKAQVTLDGKVYSMAFSPDGTTLAIGFYSGEVSLWDITTKSNIVRLGSPLVAGTSDSNSAYALAYTPDGKFLAAGLFDFTVRLVNLQPKVALQKAIDFLPWSLAFTPDGLGLAVGERDNGVLLYCRP
jgi:WD40 repeat protein